MFTPTFNLLTTLLLAARSSNLQFHDWCSSVGITTPLARLETTTRSVAGRGVFATEDIQAGDVVITIPEDVVLHEFNAATSFQSLAKKLWSKAKVFGKGQGQRRWWHRFTKRRRLEENFEFTDSSDLWQATLTSFCLACLEDEDHPWAHWISQWQRNDPMQALFEKGATWRDESEVLECVNQLAKLLPDVSPVKLRAAVEMRLGRLEELRTIFDLKDEKKDFYRMFGVLTSRAIELGDGVFGVLPMFDMLNHSDDPNLALSFDGKHFSLWGVRDIAKGEEFFVCYKDKESQSLEWDEDDAVWMLVQWGIPTPKSVENNGARLQENETRTPVLA